MIPGVPYDAEIEYLESAGTQWIDTGIYGTQNTIANLRGCNLDSNSTSWGFGSRVAWANRMFVLYNGSDQGFRYVFGWGNGQTSSAAISPVSATTGTMVDFVIAQQCSVDGQVLPTWPYYSFQTLGTLKIFGAYTAGVVYCGKWRFSNVKITVQGLLVRDFIPVRVGTVGYMYDRVTKKLFGNQGTGSFVVGPDVARPVMGLHFMKPHYVAKDYVQDGLVAMWDGIENAGWGVHDASATTWKELVSGANMNLVSAVPHDNYVYFEISNTSTKTVFGISGLTVVHAEATWAIDGPVANYNNFLAIQQNGLLCNGGMRRNESNALTWGRARKSAIGGEYGIVHCTSGALGATNGFYHNGAWVAATGVSGWDASYSHNGFIEIWQNNTWRSKGKIYNIRLYSRALTADEIAHNYAVDKVRFNLTEVA